LTGIATREQACIRAGETCGAIRLSGDFHLKLADIAGNRPLRELLRQLVAQTSLAIARYVPASRGMCHDDDHDRLVAAIANGSIRESQNIMEAHLTACERRLMLGAPEESNNLQAVFADVVLAE
jgi:DNA-binding GntR family transcriptional regulator